MIERAASFGLGFLPTCVMSVALPISALTGLALQTVGDWALAVVVAAIVPAAVRFDPGRWSWLVMGLATGSVIMVSVSWAFPHLLLADIPIGPVMAR